MNLVSYFSQESWNNILWNHTFLLQSFCVYLVTCTYVISVRQPQLPPGVLQHCPHVTFPRGYKCVTDTIFVLQRENEKKEKKAEGMKLHASYQTGTHLALQKKDEEEPPLPFTFQRHRDRVSLWEKGWTPSWSSSNALAGWASEETHLNCHTSPPAGSTRLWEAARLRAQPRWEHENPSVQEQAVREDLHSSTASNSLGPSSVCCFFPIVWWQKTCRHPHCDSSSVSVELVGM